jgi:hypothetical protein
MTKYTLGVEDSMKKVLSILVKFLYWLYVKNILDNFVEHF